MLEADFCGPHPSVKHPFAHPEFKKNGDYPLVRADLFPSGIATPFNHAKARTTRLRSEESCNRFFRPFAVQQRKRSTFQLYRYRF
ncbi:hypothetical protein [Sinorhizobium medicae]|uniref:hypothetical protein n=1 Tax=Sinorhizobium medicae TaxID=110321 RepID=UPI0009DAB81A|nr:hypothetical protein [Sinorhizobium medicae]